MSFFGVQLFFLLLLVDVYRVLFVRMRHILSLFLGLLISPLVFVLCVSSRNYRYGISRELLGAQGAAHMLPQWLAKSILKFAEPNEVERFLIEHSKEQCEFKDCPWHSGDKK